MSNEFHIPEPVVIAKSFCFDNLSFVSIFFFLPSLPNFSRRILRAQKRGSAISS
jgi:hypothetical protein